MNPTALLASQREALDLSALSSAQASDLEQIASAGIGHFINLASNARERIKQAGTEHYLAESTHELREAIRMEALARAFLKAAHDRALQAHREECIAVRMIEAFAVATAERFRALGSSKQARAA